MCAKRCQAFLREKLNVLYVKGNATLIWSCFHVDIVSLKTVQTTFHSVNHELKPSLNEFIKTEPYQGLEDGERVFVSIQEKTTTRMIKTIMVV